MLERIHTQERSNIDKTRRALEAIGEAYKTEGRVLAYIIHSGPHVNIRFITNIVKLDVERFMDNTVSVTRTFPGEEEGTVESKTILDRVHIKPGHLARVLKKNLPRPKKVL
jgi:thiamine phosphate synthase YjbQ (UPF0047 family)